MEILTKEELRLRLEEFIDKIKNGDIFIYPTDTIYGIGCNAMNDQAIAKIRKIKGRESTPFSVWVPSKNWIEENCLTSSAENWLKKLPGPYTLILPCKKGAVGNQVNPNKDSLGVRLPDHWFHKVVNKVNIPIITTSVNKSGKSFMVSIENVDPEIEKEVEFMIYEGPKEGRPSKIVDVQKEEVKER